MRTYLGATPSGWLLSKPIQDGSESSACRSLEALVKEHPSIYAQVLLQPSSLFESIWGTKSIPLNQGLEDLLELRRLLQLHPTVFTRK